MDVLLQMKAYGAADELYTYGKHARGSNGVSISIGDFATTKHRSIVPEFDVFVRYYTTDTYADEIIRTALDPLKGSWTDEQRRTVAIKSSQILVMYLPHYKMRTKLFQIAMHKNSNRLGQVILGIELPLY